MRQRMLILIGLPASGKSTFANELMQKEWGEWAYINWDSLRHSVPNYKFSAKSEQKIREQSYDQARVAALHGLNIIVDNTNLNPKTLSEWVLLAGTLGMSVETKIFDTSVEECIRRDNARNGQAYVGPVVINRMALSAGLIKFPEDRKIVIVDVDGTLADCTHRRLNKQKKCQSCKGTGLIRYYSEGGWDVGRCCQGCGGKGMVPGTDWDLFFRPELIYADPPFPVVVDWVRELYKDYIVVIVSGRPENKAGISTVNWLAKNEIPYHHIFMRGGEDKRDDTVVKKEILDKLPKNKIAFCIDDRNRVVDMWRANGLTCYQVIDREQGDF